MEKFPNSTEENSNAKQWFAGVQEELAKERAKTQEDYDRENARKRGDKLIDVEELKKQVEAERAKNIEQNGGATKKWFAGVQEELAKERAKTQEDYNNEN